ncbi:MAG: hypothetical protein P8178_09375, partial [Candidatus Thiodiazotropha sp.]
MICGAFSGHACPIGACQYQLAASIDIGWVMLAGDWERPEIPACYGRNSQYGASATNTLVETSSGDDHFTANDDYLVLHDATSTSRPAVAHLFAARNGAVRPDEVNLEGNHWHIRYHFAVPAGSTRTIMHLGLM